MRKILTALIILTISLSINACSNSSDNSKEDVKTETRERTRKKKKQKETTEEATEETTKKAKEETSATQSSQGQKIFIKDQNGIYSKATLTFNGDDVIKLSYHNQFPAEKLGITNKEEAESKATEYSKIYEGIEGVNYSSGYDNGVSTEELEVDFSNIKNEDLAKILSLELTQENLDFINSIKTSDIEDMLTKNEYIEQNNGSETSNSGSTNEYQSRTFVMEVADTGLKLESTIIFDGNKPIKEVVHNIVPFAIFNLQSEEEAIEKGKELAELYQNRAGVRDDIKVEGETLVEDLEIDFTVISDKDLAELLFLESTPDKVDAASKITPDDLANILIKGGYTEKTN